MSLVQKSKTAKRFYKKLKNFSTASIEIGSSDSSIDEFRLILDGILGTKPHFWSFSPRQAC